MEATRRSRVYPCERAAGEHRGRWFIQTYHATGNPYADELCPHYSSREAAREAVRNRARPTPVDGGGGAGKEPQ